MPQVSIIVPTYNHQAFIRECLESISRQTFEDWEAIIIDDGSDDLTGEIASSFVNSDPRFKYYYQENKGLLRLGENINLGLRLSSGELIAIIEGDDVWPTDKLQIQITGFQRKEVGIVWGDGFKKYEAHTEEMKGYDGDKPETVLRNYPIGSALKYFIFDGNFFKMPTCSVMYRKDSLEAIGGFYQPTGMPWCDKSTWALLSCLCEFHYMPKNLGYWRWHSGQATQNKNNYLTTFDYVFDDTSAPELLRTNIEKFKAIYTPYSTFVALHRELCLKNILKILTECLFNPLNSWKAIRIVVDTKFRKTL